MFDVYMLESKEARKESETVSKKNKEGTRERNCAAGAAYCRLAKSRRLPLFSVRVCRGLATVFERTSLACSCTASAYFAG